MNQNEVKEIRRRFKIDGNSIFRIYGCYVNANKDIISTFETSPGMMPAEEEEMYLKLLKKVLSGKLEKNLLDIEFTTEQARSSVEHKLLMDLKDSSLGNSEVRDEICRRIIDGYRADEKNYLILMAQDTYDVSVKDKNDEEMFDASDEIFRYVICAVCPVKASKLELKYNNENGRFDSANTGQIASNPEVGFMFPAYNDRAADIYHAMYYVKDPAELQDGVIEGLFNSEPPVSAVEQKFRFSDALETAVEKELSFEVVKDMHRQMREAIQTHKEIDDPEPLEFSITQTADLLRETGVTKEKAADFEKACSERMGEDGVIRPLNVIDADKFEIKTPDVQIKVSPDAAFILSSKVIDGRKYILIPADTEVTVNGIEINISSEEE